jgi:hypothetical protein
MEKIQTKVNEEIKIEVLEMKTSVMWELYRNLQKLVTDIISSLLCGALLLCAYVHNYQLFSNFWRVDKAVKKIGITVFTVLFGEKKYV